LPDAKSETGSTVPAAHRLDPLLAPASLALLGASPRPDTPGHAMVAMPLAAGYGGRLLPVNPRYGEVQGLDCYPTLAELPERAEHVAIGLGNESLEAAVRATIEHGAKAATIFAPCFLPEESGPKLSERIKAMAREAGLLLCGPNTMGFYNLQAHLRVCAFPSPADMEPGGITFITQSGSVFAALANNDRRPRFNLIVTCGAEYTVSVADYLGWSLAQASTRVVGLFLETVRDPAGFEAALAEAAGRELPIVALKVGRTAESAEMARTHTGAIAGNDAAYEALFRRYGVIRVRSVDEMVASLLLFQGGRRAGPGGLATIHDSGGEQQMITDLASDIGVPFAKISPETTGRIAGQLEPGLEPRNPLDAWGSFRDLEPRFSAMFQALLDDPQVAAGLMVFNIRDGYYLSQAYAKVAKALWPRTTKPFAVAPNTAAVRHRDMALDLTRAGIPVLDGTEEALKAVKHLFAFRDFHDADRTPPDPADPALRAKWRPRLTRGEVLSEAEALALLSDYGVPVVAARAANTREAARGAAEALGYPVALKAAAPGVLHKTEAGGVRLNLTDADRVTAAYDDMAARLGPEVLVSRMAPKGAEVALGALFDPQFGPCIMVAAGGVLIEVLAERAFAMAPVNRDQAKRLLAGLPVSRLLAGLRGAPPADLDSLAAAIERFSVMAHDLGHLLGELDVNPVIAGVEGALAVDALVIPEAAGQPA
jgi:acyl-CoA synthetase (NDP forming)